MSHSLPLPRRVSTAPSTQRQRVADFSMSGGAQRRVGLGYGAGDADVSSPFSTFFFFFPFFYILLNEIYDKQSPQSPFPITTPECGPRHGSLCDHAVPSPRTLVMAEQTGWSRSP